MQADPSIIQGLNTVLKDELTAINQFFLHARMLANWGLGGLGGRAYHASIEAMKQADTIIKRVLFLEGLPNLQDLGALAIGETPTETLGCDHRLLLQLRTGIVAVIATCEELRDYQTREHLDAILHEVEELIDWHETQQELLERLGSENYLQSHMDDAGED